MGVESSSPRLFIKRARSFTDPWVGSSSERSRKEGKSAEHRILYSLCHGPYDEAVHDNAIVLVSA